MQGNRFIGLSHTVEHGMETYPGLPRPLICDYLTREHSRPHYARGCRPVHTILLGAGIPVAEHLCGPEVVPETPCRFFAVPVKVSGLGTFPVRAFAIAPERRP